MEQNILVTLCTGSNLSTLDYTKKHVLWDTWIIYNTYAKCVNQANSYDCGPIAIRFIDLDTIGASLDFTHDMVRYRDNLQ